MKIFFDWINENTGKIDVITFISHNALFFIILGNEVWTKYNIFYYAHGIYKTGYENCKLSKILKK